MNIETVVMPDNPIKRGRGRPKGSKNKPKNVYIGATVGRFYSDKPNFIELDKAPIPNIDQNKIQIGVIEELKRKRGRPKGSKNKKETNQVSEEITNILAKRLIPELNQMVRYWDDGWRYGTLIHIGNQTAEIRHPITRKITVPVEDIRVVEEKYKNDNQTTL